MKVFKASQYGGPEVLQLQDINEPELNTGQLLIKLKSTAANSGYARLRRRTWSFKDHHVAINGVEEVTTTHSGGRLCRCC